MNTSAAVLLGGALGAWLRYSLSRWVQAYWGAFFPVSSVIGTLVVNSLGCLVFGMLVGFFEGRYGTLDSAPTLLRLFLMTGFLGSLTTFSSYEFEIILLLKQGHVERSILYCVGSIVLGLLAFLLGFKSVKHLMPFWG